MIEILKKDYWSKAEMFILPLTGLSKSSKYVPEAFLFWDEYSIENFQLILKYSYGTDYEDFTNYCRKTIFPFLDKKGYLVECYDGEGETVFILDISEWALDIELFLKGKYSKLSRDAKDVIIDFHTFYNKGAKVPPEVLAILEPNTKYKILDSMSGFEYVAENYGIDLKGLMEVGELASLYDREKETLTGFTAKIAENK